MIFLSLSIIVLSHIILMRVVHAFWSSSSALSLGSPGSSGRWSRPGSAGEEDEEPDTWRATLPVLEDSLEPTNSSLISGHHQRLGGRSASSGKRSSSSLLASARSRTPSEERKSSNKGLSELDRKVEQAARAARKQCRCDSDDAAAAVDATADPNKSPGSNCDKLKVRRLGGGKYNIAGRNVFVRVSNFILLLFSHLGWLQK